MVTDLAPHQVFVFGSNATGFHGEGAAGIAFRGKCAVRGPDYIPWRSDPIFNRAMHAPVGSPDRIGHWAVYGQPHGFQVGHNGKSYAIVTIERPGNRRSVSLREIYSQLLDLVNFANLNTDYEFLIAPIGSGYAGYTVEEIDTVWRWLFRNSRPINFRFV